MKPYLIPFLVASSLMAQGVKWETSLEAAKKRARVEHKLIFMDVWTEWCGWCLKLQKDTFPTAEGQKALAGMVPLSLKTELRDRTPTPDKAVERQYELEGYPALFILDAEGKPVASHFGYLKAPEFASWINGVAAGRK